MIALQYTTLDRLHGFDEGIDQARSLFCRTSAAGRGRRIFVMLRIRARRQCRRREGPDPRPLVGREDGPVVGVVPVNRHSIRSLATEPGAAQRREIVAKINSEN